MEHLLKNKYIKNISLGNNNIIIHFKKGFKKDPQCKFINESKIYNGFYIIKGI